MDIILGGKGRLGSAFTRKYKDFVSLGYDECDITKKDDIEKIISLHKPKRILNFAAITDMEKCEENPALCNKVNSIAVKGIAEVCRKRKIHLIQISTDTAVDPVNEYSKSKLSSESFVKDFGLVVRVNFYDKGSFIPKNLLSKEPKQVFAYTNVYFNPISIFSFIDILYNLVKEKKVGLYSVGIKEKVSVYDFAVAVANKFGISADLVKKGKQIGNNLRIKRSYDTYINPDISISLAEDLERFKNELEKQKNFDNIAASG